MTLIFASIPRDSPPILASDLLVTGGTDENPDLPSGRNIEGSFVEAHSDLYRKLYVITPYFVVLMAGRYYDAKGFLEEIKRRVCENCDARCIYEMLQNVWASNDYREISIIAMIYHGSGFICWRAGQVQEKALPRIGKTWCSGSGAENFLNKLQSGWSTPEQFLGVATPEYKSLLRIVTICQSIVSNELLDDEDENYNVYHLYGGFMEFCYFSYTHNRFILVNNITTLFWYIKPSLKPPYTFYFGFAPRDENAPNNFHFYRTRYSENGLIIQKFTNMRYTPKGHMVKKKEYHVLNLIDSLNDFDSISDGKFVFNAFEVPVIGNSVIPNRLFHTSYENDKKWIKIYPVGNNYETIITKFASNQALDWVVEFMNNRNLKLNKPE